MGERGNGVTSLPVGVTAALFRGMPWQPLMGYTNRACTATMLSCAWQTCVLSPLGRETLGGRGSRSADQWEDLLACFQVSGITAKRNAIVLWTEGLVWTAFWCSCLNPRLVFSS